MGENSIEYHDSVLFNFPITGINLVRVNMRLFVGHQDGENLEKKVEFSEGEMIEHARRVGVEKFVKIKKGIGDSVRVRR
ncbi:MAG TPA: hypothetical protein VMV49_17670 [Candidatus Deferrimicrobium sp.]|nr:hypothetical protein [Candidatus Deferrimicrobium sp.]